jgi:hypothetical protein
MTKCVIFAHVFTGILFVHSFLVIKALFRFAVRLDFYYNFSKPTEKTPF